MTDTRGRLWSGRLPGGSDARVRAFTSSLELDRRIARHDIRGSVAHARMLGKQGIIPQADAASLVTGLERLAEQLSRGEWSPGADAEDVHTAVEQELTRRLGDVGGKLHTARSRNDQIALDLRLLTVELLDGLDAALLRLARALVSQARTHVETVMPGYTHLQRAQVVSLAHHLLAHVEALLRDSDRVAEARARTAVSPLGAAALAGSPYPVDPAAVASELGLRPFRNSIDAVSDRDFLVEFVFASALAAVHASRLAEEIVLWSSAEFAFVDLAPEDATGSSIMPQKKNPDVAELVRGRAGRAIGDLVAVLTTLKGLPLAYGSDLQEHRQPLYDAAEITEALDVLALVIGRARFDPARLRQAADDGMLAATDLADHLARQGVPFREAHTAVGRLVSGSLAAGRSLRDLSLADLRACHPAFDDSALEELSVDRSLASRASPGGTAPERVREALAAVAQRLGE